MPRLQFDDVVCTILYFGSEVNNYLMAKSTRVNSACHKTVAVLLLEVIPTHLHAENATVANCRCPAADNRSCHDSVVAPAGSQACCPGRGTDLTYYAISPLSQAVLLNDILYVLPSIVIHCLMVLM